MNAFVARQVILDAKREVFGYELLFRGHSESTEAAIGPPSARPLRHLESRGPGNVSGGPGEIALMDPASATLQVLSNSLLSIGLGNLVGSARAFVNFDRDTLLSDWHTALPPESTVIELLETVEPDAEVIKACRKMRRAGYQVALDDFKATPDLDPLLEQCHIVKIELGAHSRERQTQLIQQYHGRGLKVLAEKVETYEEFRWAQRTGYDYFQGYFFARPELLSRRQLSAAKVNCLRLLSESQRPELDFDQLESIIASEVSFTYKLLRYVNSALLGSRKELESVRHALFYLGSTELRKWVAMAALPAMGQNKPAELVLHSLTRARMCQELANRVHRGGQQAAFLIGLFSLLDALMDRPLSDTLEDAGLAPQIADVLLGTAPESDALVRIYRLTLHYEMAQWDEVTAVGSSLGLSVPKVSEVYLDAVCWARSTFDLVC